MFHPKIMFIFMAIVCLEPLHQFVGAEEEQRLCQIWLQRNLLVPHQESEVAKTSLHRFLGCRGSWLNLYWVQINNVTYGVGRHSSESLNLPRHLEISHGRSSPVRLRHDDMRPGTHQTWKFSASRWKGYEKKIWPTLVSEFTFAHWSPEYALVFFFWAGVRRIR